jgi:hypothetical protein
MEISFCFRFGARRPSSRGEELPMAADYIAT